VWRSTAIKYELELNRRDKQIEELLRTKACRITRTSRVGIIILRIAGCVNSIGKVNSRRLWECA